MRPSHSSVLESVCARIGVLHPRSACWLLAQDGASALDELLERYWHAVAAYVLRLTGSMDAAADVTQDTFCRLWERRSKWRIAGSVRGLLFQARHFFRARLAR
jgi:hypothetical protein